MEILTEGCKKLGISLTEKQEEQFLNYYHLLLDWNSRVNLTGITEYSDVMRKHFLDSLCLVQLSGIDKAHLHKVIDVGTGAGFPGIPLKIIFPDLQLVLLDSLNKRIKFLDALKDELGLKNVTAIHGRAEEYGRNKEYRGQFDLCVSRAVANLAVLSEYCIPLVRTDGDFVAYKSGKIQEELKDSQRAIDLLGGKIYEKADFTIPETHITRSLIHIKKIRATPGKYPRKNGIPAKAPLQ